MAKRHRTNLITASFHYLTKTEYDPVTEITSDIPFTNAEFEKIIRRVSDTAPIDDNDEDIISRIKAGIDLPFLHHETVSGHLHFGTFEGAYYGQQYRNNRLGVISAESLNLRTFHYLVTLLRDGKILVGVTYNGNFGDYDGLRSCFFNLLDSKKIASRSIKSVSDELGAGEPVEVKLTYRASSSRPERKGLFGRSGVIAIKATEYGDGFKEEVLGMANSAKGPLSARKASIARLVNSSELVELDDEDIVACSALVREEGRYRTIYFLGENSFATKFLINAAVNHDGHANVEQVKNEMIRVMRERILPLLAS